MIIAACPHVLVPDGKRFYVDDDGEQKNIGAYDVAADGSITYGRVFGEEKGRSTRRCAGWY
jgi:hypothetical protein